MSWYTSDPSRWPATAAPPAFDPARSTVVLAPERGEPGYWVGCPGGFYEAATGRFVLTYRQRRPRGVEPDRGWRCAVAVSDDGRRFEDVWAVEKHELATPSMERFSLLPGIRGGYQLYVSYVDPADHRWRIDLVESESLSGFDLRKATTALDAESTGTEGVKDPYAVRTGGRTYLFASFARAREFTPQERTRAHATADIYHAGVTTCPSGLATSTDGRSFGWRGPVLEVGDGWDSYQARLGSIVPTAEGYLGFYDGSGSSEENYEERCGLAFSPDLTRWRRLTPAGPWVETGHATGSVRYVDALLVDRQWWIYFEMTRPDGAHELRLSQVAEPGSE